MTEMAESWGEGIMMASTEASEEYCGGDDGNGIVGGNGERSCC